MHLQIGELAKRTGLTVRALHHYDAIGLLSPSARTDAGYRLYNREDIARLHQIQALRRFGVALGAIGTYLANPGSTLAAIVDQQIEALTRQIEQADALRDQLTRLKRELDDGKEPELGDWLTTLELMTMYDKYLSKEQRERMPFYNGSTENIAEWTAMVACMQAFMDAGTPPATAQVQQAARNWMIMLERDTAGDPQLLAGIHAIQDNEPVARERNGVTPQLTAYVQQAFGAYRLGLYVKYLTPGELDFMRANAGKRAHEWVPLIARLDALMQSGVMPKEPAAQALAHEWMALFCSFAGTDPATHLRIREVHTREPGLLTGTFISDQMMAYIEAAFKPH